MRLVTAQGDPAHMLIYYFTAAGIGADYRIEQFYTKVGEYLYILSYYVPQKRLYVMASAFPDYFFENYQVFKHMKDTFCIKESAGKCPLPTSLSSTDEASSGLTGEQPTDETTDTTGLTGEQPTDETTDTTGLTGEQPTDETTDTTGLTGEQPTDETTDTTGLTGEQPTDETTDTTGLTGEQPTDLAGLANESESAPMDESSIGTP